MMSVYLTEVIVLEKTSSLAYYFCVGQETERNKACAVLRGLLWQITGQRPELLQYLAPYLDPPERSQATLSSEETLWRLFTDICRHAEMQRLYCLVDGVDECVDDSMHWLVDKFMSVTRSDDHRNLSLVVSSRPVAGLDDSVCITLDPDYQGQVSADVAIFVQSKVRELSKKLGLDEDFEANAASVLLEKSQGTFLWVGFVMAELLMKKTRSQVEKAMYGLPKGLPAVYARMLQSIEAEDRENSKRLLTCVALAFKPLYLEALADILDCQGSETISEEQATLDAIALCAPMLQLGGKTVEFVHLSAKDYLLRDEADQDLVLEDFRISFETANLYMARRCLQSLIEDTWLQYYAIMNWPKHAKRLDDLASDLVENEPTFFQRISPARDSWWRRYSINFPGLPKVAPPRLHMACFLGLKSWVLAIVSDELHSGKRLEDLLCKECPGGWLALNYAAETASEDMVKLLLNFTPNGEFPPEQLVSALCRALLSQREEPVRLLLHLGANSNVKNIDRKSLLLSAVALKSKVMAQSPLAQGADSTVIDDSGVFALQAAYNALPVGFNLHKGLTLVKLLLEVGVNPNTRSRGGGHTLLNYAVFHGRPSVVEVFLKHGADPTLANAESRRAFSGLWKAGMKDSALHTAIARAGAAEPGGFEMLRAMISSGLDINKRNHRQETVLHIATTCDGKDDDVKIALFEMLLHAGVDVNARRHDGKTALHITVKGVNYLETTRTLCKHGADVNVADSLGDTALHLAVDLAYDPSTGDLKLMRLLHSYGANLGARNSRAETPLHIAAKTGYLRSTRTLVDCGASLDD